MFHCSLVVTKATTKTIDGIAHFKTTFKHCLNITEQTLCDVTL